MLLAKKCYRCESWWVEAWKTSIFDNFVKSIVFYNGNIKSHDLCSFPWSFIPKMRFSYSSCSVLHKTMWAVNMTKRPCLKAWSFRFNVLSLQWNRTFCAGNHGAVNLKHKSHGIYSFICRKPWSCQSKHINLMAFIASYAENHGAVTLNA